ncbi:hypothetical protein MTO96_024511 [Rhipicephalus appendiculatus]
MQDNTPSQPSTSTSQAVTTQQLRPPEDAAFQRRALDRTCLSRFQSRWTCPRPCSGGPSKVRGRGLVSGSCQGAVAEAELLDEAYRVRPSSVVA